MILKKLPKTRKISHLKKVKKSKKDIINFRQSYLEKLAIDEIASNWLQGNIDVVRKGLESYFDIAIGLYYVTRDAGDLSNLIEALNVANSIFSAQMKQYMGAVGDSFSESLCMPNFIHAKLIQDVTFVSEIPNYNAACFSYTRWGEALCYAIATRNHDITTLLLNYTEEDAWRYHSSGLGYCGGNVQYPMIYVRYLKGMLDPMANHQRLYEQFMAEFPINNTPFYRVMIEPFYFIAIDDEAGFANAITQATQVHKRHTARAQAFYSSPFMNDYSPFLLAAAVLAVDTRQWEPPVNNSYLYRWWIFDDESLVLPPPYKVAE
ncbi:Imm49 family immunity protein [Psychrobium sp. nBUS_13]|uniref:Imm49 family immunity protein n=1 Tax=Psychrobium sp. nBUS_13 TaxID=3395319 RepID=UPI003EB877A6